jgi:hypothetical protein
MTLNELKTLLTQESGKHFRLRLPDGSPVPVSFHITEVGLVHKTFIDCGGTLRENRVCQLQVWVGEDEDHRIMTQKAAGILEKAGSFLLDDSLPVEMEYEDEVISQYTVSGHEVDAEGVIITLGHKHTACLAPELCGLEATPAKANPCCGPAGCC